MEIYPLFQAHEDYVDRMVARAVNFTVLCRSLYPDTDMTDKDAAQILWALDRDLVARCLRDMDGFVAAVLSLLDRAMEKRGIIAAQLDSFPALPADAEQADQEGTGAQKHQQRPGDGDYAAGDGT